MAWIALKDTDLTDLETCIRHSANNSLAHAHVLGTDSTTQADSASKFAAHIVSKNLAVKVEKDYAQDNSMKWAIVYFHRMQWMSTYGVRDSDKKPFGPVWVLTVSFDETIFPTNGVNDQPYIDFVKNLTTTGGPIRTFLQEQTTLLGTALNRLFIVGPISHQKPSDKRPLGQLERVANIMGYAGGNWSIVGTTDVHEYYSGVDPSNSNPVPIPQKFLYYWGLHSAFEFRLTELLFT